MTLFPDQGILAGAAPAEAGGRTFFCTYRVTDAGAILPPQTASWGLRLLVGPSAAPPALWLAAPAGIALSVKVELYDRPRERVRGLNVTLEHRF